MEIIEKLKDVLNKYFKNDKRIAGIVLFGSLAREHFTEDSDIDLLIILKDKNIDKEKFKLEILEKLEKEFPEFEDKFDIYFDTDFDEILFYPVKLLLVNDPIEVADRLELDPDKIKEEFELEKEAFKLRETLHKS